MKHSTLSSSPNSGNTIVSGIPQRPIKFRAWDNSDGVMYETICFEDMMKMQIMQFTGSLDITGKEIYEGDIVYLAGVGYCKVVFSHAAWAFENSENLCFFSETEWSDVGNIMGSVFTHSQLLG